MKHPLGEEADVVVRGTALTHAQVMAVRVACSQFYNELMDPDALGKDVTGRAMAKAYKERLGEVLTLMIGNETCPYHGRGSL
jgi:hypothetical protein